MFCISASEVVVQEKSRLRSRACRAERRTRRDRGQVLLSRDRPPEDQPCLSREARCMRSWDLWPRCRRCLGDRSAIRVAPAGRAGRGRSHRGRRRAAGCRPTASGRPVTASAGGAATRRGRPGRAGGSVTSRLQADPRGWPADVRGPGDEPVAAISRPMPSRAAWPATRPRSPGRRRLPDERRRGGRRDRLQADARFAVRCPPRRGSGRGRRRSAAGPGALGAIAPDAASRSSTRSIAGPRGPDTGHGQAPSV